MEKAEKYASLKNTKFGQKMIITAIAAFVIMAVISTWILYPIRNHKSDDVAIRFLRNSENLRSEVGEITKIIGYGMEIPNKSEEIARRLQNGENLSDINISKEKDNSQFVLTGDDYGSWRSGRLIGSKKTIEVQLYLRKNEFGEFGNNFYYTVTEAKYRAANGDWKNIPIGWLENYFLLFK